MVRAVAALMVSSLAACGGGTPTPTAAPTSPAPPAATPSPTAATASTPATGDVTLEAPDSVEAGAAFEVAWTGPNNAGDYVTIVAAGATAWTNEDYFNTHSGSPGTLTAPLTAGDYELWYVANADDSVVARRPITVLPFSGSLLAPDQVAGGTVFEVAWNGPDGPGDYITIVPVGSEPSFYMSYRNTSEGSPVELIAPVTPGAYEVWYVTGNPREVMARRPIDVAAVSASLEAPASVKVEARFDVAWTGPDGPGDYITIVPVGSEPGDYLSYDGTSSGSPAGLTAPEEPGDYELWYVIPSRGGEEVTVAARRPIEVVP